VSDDHLKEMLPQYLLVAFELRLVSPEQIIALADKMIAKCAQPPDWLVEIACSPPKFREIFHHLRHLGLPEQTDDPTFLALVAVAFLHKKLPLEKAASLLFEQICLTDWKQMTALRQQIYILDDEMEWNKSKAMKTCESILRPFLSDGEKMVDAIYC